MLTLTTTLLLGVSKEAIALKCLAVPILVEGVARGLPNLASNWYDLLMIDKASLKMSRGGESLNVALREATDEPL